MEGPAQAEDGYKHAASTPLRAGAWAVLQEAVRQHPWLLLGWAMGIAVSCTCTLLFPYLVSLSIDRWRMDALALSVLCAVAAALACSTALRFYCITLFGEFTAAHFKRTLLAHLLRMGGEFYDRTGPSVLMTRMTTDVGLIRFALGGACSVAARCLVTGAGSVVMLWVSNAHLALWLLAALPCLLLLMLAGSVWLKRRATQLQEAIVESTAMASERLAAYRVVQSFCRETQEAATFAQGLARGGSAARRLAIATALVQSGTLLVIGCSIALALLEGALLREQGVMSNGELIQFGLYSGVLVLSAVEASHAHSMLVSARAALQRIDAVLREPVVDVRAGMDRVAEGNEVVFSKVAFAYPGRLDHRVLADISFRARSGRITALVGASGSGKSTTLSLLQRFYSPCAGQILVGGLPLSETPIEATRAQISVVPQFPTVLRMSLRENIAYGSIAVSPDAVLGAARCAGLDLLADTLPLGYDTPLGAGGHPVSGGEAQRIGIARALLSACPIVLMDEPTSALDAQAERDLLAILRRLAGQRTVLVVTHRPSVMAAADHVVLIEGGRVVAEGAPTALLSVPAYQHALRAGLQTKAACHA
ncbi:ABC transporter ATP-binding protein [Stenotrophomonas beteli]|uniref:ABC transporter ATP-binding protein n=1 Tax=Stenotrophomonas beteli TaxID=3384461 RepID=A0A0R0BBZ4_9GAMM|nr:ABC transporter transmembrane domain-containing protein [Stenotrophomonas maltophilia]KRG51342.1 hypothetical protein ARC23_09470 [Stenotrophomonas maltophilia]